MKKKAFILASSDVRIGSHNDVDAYHSFLTSPIGGAWKETEIREFHANADKISILGVLYEARNEQYDYVVFIYSGHGGTRLLKTGCVSNVICLDNGEEIHECEILGISDRQLTILDSCRAPIDDEFVKASSAQMLITESKMDLSVARVQYEKQVEKSIKAQYRMYACSAGECASGSPLYGGLFTRILLEVSKQCSIRIGKYSPIPLSDIFFKTQSSFAENRLGHMPDSIFPKSEGNRFLPWALGSYEYHYLFDLLLKNKLAK